LKGVVPHRPLDPAALSLSTTCGISDGARKTNRKIETFSVSKKALTAMDDAEKRLAAVFGQDAADEMMDEILRCMKDTNMKDHNAVRKAFRLCADVFINPRVGVALRRESSLYHTLGGTHYYKKDPIRIVYRANGPVVTLVKVGMRNDVYEDVAM
jgi:hypothetical protein